MDSSTGSSIAANQDDGQQRDIEPSGSSSEFLDQSDKSSDETNLSSRSRRSAVRRDHQNISPRKELRARRGKKGKPSRKHFSDRYLGLFKDTVAEFQSGSDGVPPVDLLPTQLGAVHWLPPEKEALFKIISRKGRLDEPGIATAVGKSELEVRDYLMFLRGKEAERHLFEKQTKQISHAEIPAAVEVSEECESALEQAADALAMFQDQYDNAVAEQQHPGTWLTDWDTAKALDEQVLDREGTDSDLDDPPIIEEVPGKGLFRLSCWLELSERLFMNPGPPRLESNWHNIATEGERPALTYAAFTDFYDLTVSITRRLIQTCMFLAESRMRSTKSQGYDPKPLVKEQDVVAALEVLGMASSLSDKLLGVARRNSLRVIRGSHDKGSSGSKALTYNEVERDIASRKRSRRGRRSVSAASRSSATPTSLEDAVPDPENSTAGISASNQTARRMSPTLISIQDSESDVPVSDVSMSDIDVNAEDSQVDEYEGLAFHASTSQQKRRQIYLESQQDAYMEDLDRLESRREEMRLWQILGRNPPSTTNNELQEDLGIRPKTLRKTKEDLADWRGLFASEWEAFEERISEQHFLEAKDPRLEDESRRRSRDEARSLSTPVRTIEPEDNEDSGRETASD